MASQAKPLKGILKKPSSAAAKPSVAAKPSATARPSARAVDVADVDDGASESDEPSKPSPEEARRIALQHARIIQDERRREETVLDSILTLTELPRHPPQDSSLGGSSGGNRAAAHPSPEDAREFAAHVRLFAPGDYDALVEERNSLGRCGYALCPQPRRLFGGPKGRGGSSGGGGGGTWKLNWATGDIVPRKELEKWCSTKCARRALYIKVQLNETAVWERAGIPSITIDLLPEDDERTSRKQDHVDKVSAGLERLRLDAELALERGESGAAKATKVDMTVKEKEVGAPKEIGPSSDYDHRAIEGYAPKRTA